jgi:hypothetical protein
MIFEQKAKLVGAGALTTIAASVFALGTWKAIEGSALYMTAAEGRSETEGLMYAAMIAGTAMLASNAAVFMQGKLARVGFSTLAISLAALTVYTTHAGKAHDSDAQIDMTRMPERQRIITEAEQYQANIQRLSASLANSSNADASHVDLPDVETCNRKSKYFSRCNAQRTKQMEANTQLLAAAGAGLQTLRQQLDEAKSDKRDAEGRLAMFDNDTKAEKQEKHNESLLTNVISSILPELSSLLGSFFLGFFLKAMYLISREKHPVQSAVQFGTVGGTVVNSELYHPATGMTHSEIAHWSVLPEMTQVQQIAKTPLAAEQEFVAALEAKTAPLSIRPAQKAFPSVARRRFSEIFDEQFSANILNRRFDAKGGISYEYPGDDEAGGNTYETATAKARRAEPTHGGIYLAIHNKGAHA